MEGSTGRDPEVGTRKGKRVLAGSRERQRHKIWAGVKKKNTRGKANQNTTRNTTHEA